MISSFWLAMPTWPIPSDSGTLWASGNDATCGLQVTLVQFGISNSIYNVSLSIYYVQQFATTGRIIT